MADDWKSIELSVDLVNAAKAQIEFLKVVDDLKELYEGFFFDRALYRYEKLWIPICANYANEIKYIQPPIDVEWVWHVHMLSPTKYKKDCKALCSKLLDHKLVSNAERTYLYHKSKAFWEEKTKVSFEYTDDCTDQEDYETMITYDLKSASLRQKNFLYQVSLPHYKDRKFLEIGVERYKKFLNLKKMYPKEFVVPSYLIDIIWHSHQLHPVAYKNDTVAVLGKIFPHDDSVNDRSPDSLLSVSNERTAQIWKSVSILHYSL